MTNLVKLDEKRQRKQNLRRSTGCRLLLSTPHTFRHRSLEAFRHTFPKDPQSWVRGIGRGLIQTPKFQVPSEPSIEIISKLLHTTALMNYPHWNSQVSTSTIHYHCAPGRTPVEARLRQASVCHRIGGIFSRWCVEA